MGILSLNGTGQGELTFIDDQGSNLLADYSGVELSIELDSDEDPEPSGLVAYSYSLPDNGLTHLRNILSSFPSAPDENALIEGLLMNVEIIDELAKEMHRASTNGNAERVRLNAEAILNIIVGDQSPNHRDWNEDGIVDDPGDGYGLLLNGRNLGYLQSVYTEADAALNSPGASQPMITHGEGLMTSVQNLALWTQQLQELVSEILASPPPPDIDQKVTRAADLSDKMLNGIDLDEDGLIEPVPGEAGAEVAYKQAFRMADMPLVAVGIVNIGTGTPTFLFVTPTPTSGSGGAGGSAGTAGPTEHVPPGQTRIPPGQEDKPPRTERPGNDNNGNNGGGNGNNNGNNNDP